MWAQAVPGGNPYDFAKVNKIVKGTVYPGFCGTYSFPTHYLPCYPYPTTPRTQLGMAHLTFPIQKR